MNKTIIGITGPIASGKNEACKIFRRHGAQIIDADTIGHEAIKKGSKCCKKIVKIFGQEVLLSNGSIDRKKLGSIVFGNKELLKKLNKIVHPIILKKIKQNIKSSKKKIIVINVAVLKEIGLIPVVDKVIAVVSNKKNRIRRMIKRSGTRFCAADILKRIKSQRSNSDYIKDADVVIRNDATLVQLNGEIKGVISEIKKQK